MKLGISLHAPDIGSGSLPLVEMRGIEPLSENLLI